MSKARESCSGEDGSRRALPGVTLLLARDSIVLINALLEHDLPAPVYINIVDPSVVATAIDVGVGKRSLFIVGGWTF